MYSKTEVLRSIYLYLVSLVGVVMLIFSFIAASQHSISFVFGGSGKDLYFVSEVARDIAAILAGLLLFLSHWNIIKKEERFGPGTLSKTQNDVNFWGNLFFYIVSFIGLMIFVFSFIAIIDSFFSVNYVDVPITPNQKISGAPKLTIPDSYLSVNVKSLLQSVTSFVVGFVVWLFSWGTLQKLRTSELKNL